VAPFPIRGVARDGDMIREKLKEELRAIALATLYFSCWIGALILLKELVLAEYHIAFHHLSMALVGALVLAKVVLVMEHVPLGSWLRARPAWVDVVLRTVLYSLGVVIVLVLEKGIEGWHEHGGFGAAVKAALGSTDIDHIAANTLCVSAALFGYNVMTVVRCHLGAGGLFKLFLVPLPRSGCAPAASRPSPPSTARK
jgi:hypothetical protein